MSQSDSGQERTEQPTPKRLQDARNKGQVLRSKELNTFIMMVGASIALFVFGAHLATQTLEFLSRMLVLERSFAFDKTLALQQSLDAIAAFALAQLPLFALMMAAVFAGPAMLGGMRIGSESLAFKPEHLDPIKGLGRIFSLNSLLELLKSLLKVSWLALMAFFVGKSLYGDLSTLGRVPVGEGIERSVRLLMIAMSALTVALIPIAALDVPHQTWEYLKKLRMTRQEVKDEHKEMEGSPELKGRLRQQQREMAQRRMMDEVPGADVVITNPTHFSVALRYDPGSTGAPKVVAKGKGHLAARIREIASSSGVPIFSAPPLARALYHSTELQRHIPAGLYVAVARVLAYVYQLRSAAGTYRVPRPPTDLPVPDEYLKKAAS